ncbi:hypothetical protein J3B02_004543 [Coemansia erecta]|nr:hypothetical protein J3B02_004543 [Coemansia erecta]KAJ2888558.1 hypothetical protein FB639_000550 [Coemansia asiatica]
MDTNAVSVGPLPTVSAYGLKTFGILIYTISGAISLLAFVYGLIVVRIRPQVWRSSIFRVVLAAQILNSLRFIIRLVASYVRIRSEFGCRTLLFLNNATAILPVNLCIYCVIYLQLVVIHKVSPVKRWPRVVLITLGVIISVVPTFMFMILPPSAAGASSFCNLFEFPSRKQYLFLVGCVIIWEYLPGMVGILSVLMIGVHIIKARRATKKAMQESAQFYGTARAAHLQGKRDMLNQSIRNIIWFPITPIVSLWLNASLLTVTHYKRKTYVWLEYTNIVLIGLQSVLLAIALAVNPSVRYVVADRVRAKLNSRMDKNMDASNEQRSFSRAEYSLPAVEPLDSLSISSLSDTVSDL